MNEPSARFNRASAFALPLFARENAEWNYTAGRPRRKNKNTVDLIATIKTILNDLQNGQMN